MKAIAIRRDIKPELLVHAAQETASERARLRFMAIAAVLQGATAPQVAKQLKISRASIHRWISRFNKGGVPSLEETGRGRPSLLPEEHFEVFKRRAMGGQRGDGRVQFNGRELQDILSREFGVDMSLGGVYLLLRRLQLTCLNASRSLPDLHY